MKITIFSRNLPEHFLGGAEIHAALLAQALVKRGHRVTLVSCGETFRSQMYGGLTILKTPVFSYPQVLRTFFLPIWKALLRNQVTSVVSDADIVHAVDLDGMLLLADWKLVQPKLVATVQDYSIICPAGDLLPAHGRVCHCHAKGSFRCRSQFDGSAFSRLYYQAAYPLRFAVRSRSFLKIKHVVFISRYVKRQFRRVFGSRLQSSWVIGNFIPDSWIESPTNGIRKQYDILYVGRVEKYKGMDVLIAALTKIRSEFPRLRVGIIGAGRVAHYRTLVVDTGLSSSIQFLGEVGHADVRDYYRASRIVVVPSVWPEPCGRAVIEGMGTGAVVIGTASGGTPELVQHRRTGFLVPVNNPDSLAKTLRYVLLHYQRLGSLRVQAQDHVRKKFVSDVIVKKYESLYRTVAF